MAITAIHIQNFRSIQSFRAPVRNFNIFVGQNDEGKSNVLRALDLFFNDHKKTGFDLVWERDYCRFAPERRRKAPEIVVEIEVTPPASFSNPDPILWRRVWRREGFESESIRYRDGSELAARSKIRAFLRAMRFDYVPAIKGPEFFQSLLSSLHDMLEATVEDQVRQASGAFTAIINQNTTTILDEIESRLGLETSIQLPPNLRELFGSLEFTSLTGDQPFSLSQRGDGIKMRHVPIVLRWLAEQANHLSAPGKPKVVTVWGYEEPENNLEFRRCFELAKEFVDGCDAIQTFVTTHSPVFYSICREADPDRIQLFSVEKQGEPPTTTIRPLEAGAITDLDTSMGFLDFIEPYIRDAQHELERLRAAKASLRDLNVPTLYCEGPSDKALLEDTLRIFYPELLGALAIPASPQAGGGHSWVRDMMIAWAYSRPGAAAVGLFDKDAAAQQVRKEVNVQLQGRSHVYGVSLIPSDSLKECYQRQFNVPFSIDELLSESVWDHAQGEGWLEERPGLLSLYEFAHTDQTFNDYVDAAIAQEPLRRLIRYRVARQHKEDVCRYVHSLRGKHKRAALEGLLPTLELCLSRLGLLTEGDDQ